MPLFLSCDYKGHRRIIVLWLPELPVVSAEHRFDQPGMQ